MTPPTKELTMHLMIDNLGCPNCAAKMETRIRQLPGVSRAKLDFSTASLNLVLDPETRQNELLSDVGEIIQSIEKDACLRTGSPRAPARPRWFNSLPWRRLARFGVGIIPFILAMVLPETQVLRLPLFLAAYLILGYDVLLAAFGKIGRKQLFDENFLMAVATLGALAIREYPEAVAVMLFYQIGEIFQNMAVDHSRRSIKALMDIRPDQANQITEQGVVSIAPELVQPGAQLLIRPGERVPLDSRILEGVSSLDTAALTGESQPRPVEAGDEILAGCVNGSGLLTAVVLRPYGESAVSRILSMVEEASARKASVEQFITRFAAVYTPIMVGLAVLVALAPPLVLREPFAEWIARALILLVISCPCALVLSVPLSYFGGLGAASARGILVKGGSFLEKLATADTVVFDKTGTLTQGKFTVTGMKADRIGTDQLLYLATLAESHSSHPIAQSIIQAWQAKGRELPDQSQVSQYQDLAGRGVSLVHDSQVILLGNQCLMLENDIDLPESAAAANPDLSGATVLYLAVNGEYAGEIWLSDQLKPEAVAAIRELRSLGISRLALLSGDRRLVAEAIARQAGISIVQAELLPDQKVAALEALIAGQGRKGSVVYVGDGINDAPVLARSDVGIALGAGSDAAIESADVVIMADDLRKIGESIRLARRTNRITHQNVVLALGLKALVLILAIIGIAGIWQAVFADVGVAVLTVLNSLRVLARKGR